MNKSSSSKALYADCNSITLISFPKYIQSNNGDKTL